MYTRAFGFIDNQNQHQVGVEWKGKAYNFTLAWEFFKRITMDNKGPSFPFLQLVIEMGLFYNETFDELFETLQKYRSLDDLVLREVAKHKAPIERPQKIVCIGRNYREHAKELNNPVPKEPVFFGKSPSAITATGDFIRRPSSDLGGVHFEGELAFVIGKQGYNIPESEAMSYIAGFTLLNDVTARDLQQKDKEKGLPWFRSKNFDTFCPLGPYLIPANAVEDSANLQLETRLNGETKQSGNTKDMIFSLSEIIAYVSRYMTLVEGDVIATGTPSGVGAMQKGDVVEVEIPNFGVLRNHVL